MRFQKTRDMNTRILVRSLMLLGFTVVSFFALDYLVYMGQFGNDINQRFPEFLIVLRALAIYTWIEVSMFWVRVTLESNTDVQKAVIKAEEDPLASSIAYAVHAGKWLARLLIVMFLANLF